MRGAGGIVARRDPPATAGPALYPIRSRCGRILDGSDLAFLALAAEAARRRLLLSQIARARELHRWPVAPAAAGEP